MILYHGTAECYLESILKEGLQPQKNAWKLSWGRGKTSIISTEKPGVYLTKEPWPAVCFAELRTKYLAAKPGDAFSYYSRVFTKEKDAPVSNTKPVLLKVTLPDHCRLEEDPHSYSGDEQVGFVYKGTVPPRSITVVEHVAFD